MNEILVTDIQYRPCYVKGKKALFHRYINEVNMLLNPITYALVEYSDGRVEKVCPEDIRFCDLKINEYAFIELLDEMPKERNRNEK